MTIQLDLIALLAPPAASSIDVLLKNLRGRGLLDGGELTKWQRVVSDSKFESTNSSRNVRPESIS